MCYFLYFSIKINITSSSIGPIKVRFHMPIRPSNVYSFSLPHYDDQQNFSGYAKITQKEFLHVCFIILFVLRVIATRTNSLYSIGTKLLYL